MYKRQVLGISARKETPCGMATAGLVLSIIGVILGAIIFLACVACLGTLSSYSMMEQLNH